MNSTRLHPLLIGALALLACTTLHAADRPRVLDDFSNPAAWHAQGSDDVTARAIADHGSLCLAYDFNGVSGYATLSRKLPLDVRGNFVLSFRVRGQAPVNDLQMKLVDASGDNVWWHRWPAFHAPPDWQTLRTTRKQIEFAWGPRKDHALGATASIEFVVAVGSGGRGRVCFDDLKLEKLPPARSGWPAPKLTSTSSLPGAGPEMALDKDPKTAWRSGPSGTVPPVLTLDLGTERPLGGLELHWWHGQYASRYRIERSDDGTGWQPLRRVEGADGGEDAIFFSAPVRTRYLRLLPEAGPTSSFALSMLAVKPPEWAGQVNDYILERARKAPLGHFPRGMSGQQVYWTLVGVDGGGAHSALMSEDGALEPGLGGYSIEPFLIERGKVVTWADADIAHSLADGYLPMPSATWKAGDLRLKVSSFASGTPRSSRLLARYTVSNAGHTARQVDLALAVRPYQVDPPTQFLNTRGGISPINDLAWRSPRLAVNGQAAVHALQDPDRVLFGRLDGGGIVPVLEHPPSHARDTLHDDAGFGSAALLYHLELPAFGRKSVMLVAPLNGDFDPGQARRDPPAWFDRQRDQTAAYWHRQLDRVKLIAPTSAQPVADTLRTALADILMSRAGPALQPGTRSYARTWIRDGAMMSAALLRLGHPEAVHDFLTWYAPHQFSSGKVPCCVDKRGADPVAENDSQGELIFTAADYLRFTGDRTTVDKLWPNVRRAAAYMETLRQSLRTDAYTDGENRMFFGLMPASISHEGYSSKPMHSYWDDFWSLLGYKDAVWLARTLGHDKEAATLAGQRDQFAHDLYASIALSRKRHGIDYIPGSADLGDFDATSTTIALAPGGELDRLPEKPLHATFERYWQQFLARRDGNTDWEAYTPYELRTLGSFVRLGWRQRAQALLDFFMSDRRPAGWNQWAEVVGRDMRKPRFVGDMPHAWVASDCIRSILDMFAWHRHHDDAMVLAAGLPESWLDGHGAGLQDLRTPWGTLSYRLWKTGDTLHLKLDATGKVPPGGFVLPWPLATGTHGATTINGKPAEWRANALHMNSPKAAVDIAIVQP